MPDDKTKTPPEANSKTKELTASDAAKRVKCAVGDVLSFRDYGTHVVVVTTDGQKLSSLDE